MEALITFPSEITPVKPYRFDFKDSCQSQVLGQQNIPNQQKRIQTMIVQGQKTSIEADSKQKTVCDLSDKNSKDDGKKKVEDKHDKGAIPKVFNSKTLKQSDDKDKDKIKKKKKWKKLLPSELGFNISLFPRPVKNNCDIETDAEEMLSKIEMECDTIEKLTEPYENLIQFEGNNQGLTKFLRADRHRRTIKAHKQVKTKYCQSVLNNKGRKALYVNHRVYKMMSLDIQRLCYMPSPKREKNLLKKEFKSNYVVNPVSNKPHNPTFRPTPVQCLAHTIHKDNLPSDLDAGVANFLMNLQHRDLTPEDYDLLLHLDEARVKPKTVDENKLKSFKTDTVESNDELEVCPICMELYEKGQIRKFLPCSHVFHSSCIDAWLKNSSMNCPIDNLPIDS